MKLQFLIHGQDLKAYVPPVMVADSVNYFSADFRFETPEWQGLSKCAHFCLGEETYTIPLVNDCIAAEEGINLQAGDWELYVHGEQYESGQLVKRIITDRCRFTVEAHGGLEGSSFPQGSHFAAEEPEERDLPRVYLSGTLPTSKEEGDLPLELDYRSASDAFHAYVTLKVQGSSSVQYPKKNFTVKLFADEARESKLKRRFKNWGEQSKFVLKANWVDLSHARNVVSARLWGDCVRARADYAQLPERLRGSANQAAVDGFPVLVYVNGIYQGRYTWNVPKDAWMANMDSSKEEHCILCGENFAGGSFRSDAVIDGTDWSDEVHDSVPESIKTRWNEVVSFVRDSSDADFKANLDSYIDRLSAMDYYLFGLLCCNPDGFARNQLFLTYDGQKWYATPYDLDATWGLEPAGELFHKTYYPFINYYDHKEASPNLLHQRLQKLFMPELCARYKELRKSALSQANCMDAFEKFMAICPPYVVAEDYAATTAEGAFTEIPQQDANNIQQIRDYMVKRMDYCDKYMENCAAERSLLYSLPEAMTFDGVDDCLDTGVKLFDQEKNFTVFLDLDSSQNTVNGGRVFHCVNHEAGYGSYHGLELRHSTGAALLVTEGAYKDSGNWLFNDTIPSASRVRLAYVFQNGRAAGLRFKTASGSIVRSEASSADQGYFQHDTTLLLGCSRQMGGTALENFWQGTIYACEVYNYELTPEEIDEKLR